MRSFTTQMVVPVSSTSTAITGTRTFAWKLSRNFKNGMFIGLFLIFGQIHNPEGEVFLDRAVLRHSDLAHLRGQPLVPGLQFVGAGRHVRDRVGALFVR